MRLGPEQTPWPSVAEHPAEARLHEARDMADWVVAAYVLWLRYGFDEEAETMAQHAEQAASLYHEGLRLAGECPQCGAIYQDPWGGRHYNHSLGCCLEPGDDDGEAFRGGEAAAYEAEQQADCQRLK